MEAVTSKLWRWVAFGLAIASSFALGYVINELTHGITELPQHWWSTAPALGLLVAALIGVALRLHGGPNRNT